MKSVSKTGTAHGEAGLTLLEVLAATLIFAMVMTVLIGTSTTAVHHVGVSARRLEASLVADEILADLEIQMKQGIAPEVDESESTRDQYAIRVLRTELIQDPGAADSGGTGTGVAAQLGAAFPEVTKHMKRYDIEVSWFEQNGAQRITRTTFAYDWQLAAVEFSDLFDRSSRNDVGGFGGPNANNGGGGGISPNGSGTGPRTRPGGSRRILDGHNAARNRRLLLELEQQELEQN